jgi:hypothetical protein
MGGSRKAYPWTYADLIRALRQRYSDFKENAVFHRLKKPLGRRVAGSARERVSKSG